MSFSRITYEIIKNERIANDVYWMELRGDTSEIKNPGQFVNIELADRYLRRPMSIADWEVGDEKSGKLVIIYKVVGIGTDDLAQMVAGETIDLLTPLGNGFDVTAETKRPLLVGGGVGTPPLIALAKELVKVGKMPQVVLGFQSAEDVFGVETFKAIHPDIEVHLATVDGTEGTKGFVTQIMPALDYDYIFACGPVPMLEAVARDEVPGQYSFEARMACGFGACMGCSYPTTGGYKRICKEGPVLYKEDLAWLI